MTFSRRIAQVIIASKIDVAIFEDVLRTYRLQALLPNIKKELELHNLRTKKEELLYIESPFPLSKHSLEHIHKVTGSKGAPHEIHLTKKLLAGFKAKYRGLSYDKSMKRILEEFNT